ncbi:MAG: hypothetical protein R3323_01335 [Wenzhouxiangellaceae bacterium]|nr:hypothetical protein [Wenzhouxiangellaceae bacterium]
MAESDHSVDALQRFLKQAGMQGLINPAAARARRNALEQLSSEMTDAERADVRRIDVDDLASRYHKLEGSSIRTETLELYASRLKMALEDFLNWTGDADSFSSIGQERPRSFRRRSGGQRALGEEHRAAERITLQAVENPTSVVPVPIRDNETVYIANLPLDLDEAEAEKIARVVRAFAVANESARVEADATRGGEE